MSPGSLHARRGGGADYVDLDLRPHGGHRKLLEAVGNGKRVLDIGCSTGYLDRALQQRGNEVVGIEADPAAAAAARQWCTDVRVGDVEMIGLSFAPRSFDVVLCADVLEHLRDPGKLLARARPLLRPDGRLVLSTPNIANWTIRASLLFGRFRYADRGILDRTHTHLFTRRTLVECIEAAGYLIDEIDFTVPVPLVGTPPIEALASAVGRVRPTLFAYQFVVTAKPRWAPVGREPDRGIRQATRPVTRA